MTSVTAMINTEFSWAAEGARWATGAVQENSCLISSQPIVVFCNRQIFNIHQQLLAAHVDRRDHVFVDRFRRQGKLLAKDIQQRVTADETHQCQGRSKNRPRWRSKTGPLLIVGGFG